MSIYKAFSDQELLLRSQEDPAAFAELYMRYRKPMLYHTLSKVRHADVAEDIVQDVFLKIWKGKDRIIIQGDFRYYVFASLKNRIIDHFSNGKGEYFELEGVENMDAGVSLAADQQVRHQLFKAHIDTLMTKFPENDRKILQMRMEGYQNAEIAQVLGFSEKTVRNHYWYILKFLKSKLTIFLIFLGTIFG